MANLRDIQGLGDELAERLERADVYNSDALLSRGNTREARDELAEETGIAPERLWNFVKQADLMRVDGIGGEYAELLVAAGVDSVGELAQSDANELHKKITEVNAERGMGQPVASAPVQEWIDRATALAEIVRP
ncbi:MAG: DUF4332 domain-containing protein [Chloroflexota bacterium]|nr:DUF4332 domain-containing protein [Chloroflexota bacterium]